MQSSQPPLAPSPLLPPLPTPSDFHDRTLRTNDLDRVRFLFFHALNTPKTDRVRATEKNERNNLAMSRSSTLRGWGLGYQLFFGLSVSVPSHLTWVCAQTLGKKHKKNYFPLELAFLHWPLLGGRAGELWPRNLAIRFFSRCRGVGLGGAALGPLRRHGASRRFFAFGASIFGGRTRQQLEASNSP